MREPHGGVVKDFMEGLVPMAPSDSIETKLIDELDEHFPQQSMLDALGIVYMQYWMQERLQGIF